jgi:putative endonuclease
MYVVYVLYSRNFEQYYIGMTVDCERRVSEHNAGKSQSTKAFIPWVIIHKEEYFTRVEARNREKYLKSAAGRLWRKKHIIWPRGATE